MANLSPPRPVVHLPELPTQEEVLRKQKRARTIAARAEIQCDAIGKTINTAESQVHIDANESALCLHDTDPLPGSTSNNDADHPQVISAPTEEINCIQQPGSSMIMDFQDSMQDGTCGFMHAQKRSSERRSMHALIRQAAISSAPSAHDDEQNSSSHRKPGSGFLYRLTNMRWKRAVDSALDTSPMRSMLSHFSPSRFQRVLSFGLVGQIGNMDS